MLCPCPGAGGLKVDRKHSIGVGLGLASHRLSSRSDHYSSKDSNTPLDIAFELIIAVLVIAVIISSHNVT